MCPMKRDQLQQQLHLQFLEKARPELSKASGKCVWGRGSHLVLILGKETRNHRRQIPHPQANIHLNESFLNSKIQ